MHERTSILPLVHVLMHLLLKALNFVERAVAYKEAGADFIFAEAVHHLSNTFNLVRQLAFPFWRISPNLDKHRCLA
jgi:hypothetical protein